MSTNCDRCGYRDNEVKSGGAISEKGKRITLRIEDSEDLSRDILKVRDLHAIRGCDYLLTEKLLRAKLVVSQFRRSTSFFKPELWEADLLRWKGS
jgi:ZPR1 zinc-finger domain